MAHVAAPVCVCALVEVNSGGTLTCRVECANAFSYGNGRQRDSFWYISGIFGVFRVGLRVLQWAL